MKKEQALAFRRKIEKAASTQTDEDALESIDLYPKWAAGLPVIVGERYQYNGKLYKVLQAHTTQADWTPDVVPALFAEVSLDEWPEIPENIPSTAPWMAGDKGTWKGQHYICVMDNCVWNPDVAPQFWDLVA